MRTPRTVAALMRAIHDKSGCMVELRVHTTLSGGEKWKASIFHRKPSVPRCEAPNRLIGAVVSTSHTYFNGDTPEQALRRLLEEVKSW